MFLGLAVFKYKNARKQGPNQFWRCKKSIRLSPCLRSSQKSHSNNTNYNKVQSLLSELTRSLLLQIFRKLTIASPHSPGDVGMSPPPPLKRKLMERYAPPPSQENLEGIIFSPTPPKISSRHPHRENFESPRGGGQAPPGRLYIKGKKRTFLLHCKQKT